LEKLGGIGEKLGIIDPIGLVSRGDCLGYGPLAIQSSLKFPVEQR